MTALGNNAHIFARPSRRAELLRCFEALVGSDGVATVECPGGVLPMFVIRFPAGGGLSIEFTDLDRTPDDDEPRFGAWLEIRSVDPAALMRKALEAGAIEVKHPGHPYYFMAPGGQVFAIASVASRP